MSLRPEVERLVAEELAPLLAADASGIEIVAVDEGTREVVVRITGALRGCPGASFVKADVIDKTFAACGARVRYA